MPKIRLDMVEIGEVQENADHSDDVQAVDRVHGPIEVDMPEDTFRWIRWLMAKTADVVQDGHKKEGETR